MSVSASRREIARFYFARCFSIYRAARLFAASRANNRFLPPPPALGRAGVVVVVVVVVVVGGGWRTFSLISRVLPNPGNSTFARFRLTRRSPRFPDSESDLLPFFRPFFRFRGGFPYARPPPPPRWHGHIVPSDTVASISDHLMAGRLLEVNGKPSNPARRPRFHFQHTLPPIPRLVHSGFPLHSARGEPGPLYSPEKFPIIKAITAVRNRERNETKRRRSSVRSARAKVEEAEGRTDVHDYGR
ncbi:hypothetical protein K0M31_019438 [Melipona bicolor]|uniref:Uncharacterized protein n=1 Tax=Melipona bicolor TaxID=60889 RepID=A0AA40G2F9_9HYME|nr:hypothetical protein K0M31_019438 [Melipona bicolor]